MIFAVFNAHPTFQSGVGLDASRAKNRENRFAVGPHQRRERVLRTRWRLDSEGALVCAWRSEFVRPLVKLESGAAPA